MDYCPVCSRTKQEIDRLREQNDMLIKMLVDQEAVKTNSIITINITETNFDSMKQIEKDFFSRLGAPKHFIIGD